MRKLRQQVIIFSSELNSKLNKLRFLETAMLIGAKNIDENVINGTNMRKLCQIKMIYREN